MSLTLIGGPALCGRSSLALWLAKEASDAGCRQTLLYSQEYAVGFLRRQLDRYGGAGVARDTFVVSSIDEAQMGYRRYIFDLAEVPGSSEWGYFLALSCEAEVFVLLQTSRLETLPAHMVETAANVWLLTRVNDTISQCELKARNGPPCERRRQWVLENRRLTLQTPTEQVTP